MLFQRTNSPNWSQSRHLFCGSLPRFRLNQIFDDLCLLGHTWRTIPLNDFKIKIWAGITSLSAPFHAHLIHLILQHSLDGDKWAHKVFRPHVEDSGPDPLLRWSHSHCTHIPVHTISLRNYRWGQGWIYTWCPILQRYQPKRNPILTSTLPHTHNINNNKQELSIGLSSSSLAGQAASE